MDRVASIAQAIYNSQTVNSQGISASLRIPGKKGPDSAQEIATAIAWVLKKIFNVQLTPDEIMQIEHSDRVSMEVQSSNELPARELHLDFTATPPLLQIMGTPVVHGRDGYSELAFPWQKQSGTIGEDGTIDWKKINSVPNIEEGQRIATIHDKTVGSSGIDCFGKAIRQNPGRRQQIRWTSDSIYRDNEDPTAPSFNLIAKKSGVITYRFDKKDDPSTLSHVTISDKFRISGDIDYSLGDLETAASLEIIGSVLGNFSLSSKGFIHVSESIEGKEVRAQNVKAELITNRCIVTAKDEVETGSISYAEAAGTNILVKNNAAQASLLASEIVLFEKGAAITNVNITANTAKFHGNTFAGSSTIVLGEKLFAKIRLLLPEFEEFEVKRAESGRTAKEAATESLNQLGQLEQYGVIQKSTVLHNLCLSLKQNFIRSFQTVQPISPEIMIQAAMFREKVEEKVFEYSISRKLEKLNEALALYNSAISSLITNAQEHGAMKEQAELLSARINNDLAVILTEPQAAGKNASIRIVCGEAETTLHAEDLNGSSKKIRYVSPADGLAEIHKGSLEIVSGPGK